MVHSRLALLIALAAGCSGACSWGPSAYEQTVDVSPLADLKLPPDLRTLRDVLKPPVFVVEVLDGRWMEKRDAVLGPGCAESFTWGGARHWGVKVEVVVLDEPDEASVWFYDACDHAVGAGDTLGRRFGGAGDDRFCVTEVREYANEYGWFLWWGDRGAGTYESAVIFQKGRVVIKVREDSESRTADKDREIRGLANLLRPLAIRDSP